MLTSEDYLVMAYEEATKSPDPSTQNGAVIPVEWEGSHADGRPHDHILKDCNRLPDGVKLLEDRLQRPKKYGYIEHAERNVVYRAAKEGWCLEGLTMYVPWASCTDCARAIVQSGITRVVRHKDMMDKTPEHWKESIEIADLILSEGGVQVVEVSGKLGANPIRFNGEIWHP